MGALRTVSNLAARVEALTKDVGATLLVPGEIATHLSGEIAARLSAEFRLGRIESVPVKGKTEPLQLVEILPRACA
jgi:hypothetical protein